MPVWLLNSCAALGVAFVVSVGTAAWTTRDLAIATSAALEAQRSFAESRFRNNELRMDQQEDQINALRTNQAKANESLSRIDTSLQHLGEGLRRLEGLIRSGR